MWQQQDKPTVSYTKNFIHYFEICFIILHLTHPFIPSDGKSLTLIDVKILQASIFRLGLSMPFLWNEFAYIVSSLPLMFSFFSSIHTSQISFSVWMEWLFQPFSVELNTVPLEHEFNTLQLWEAGSLTLRKGYCLLWKLHCISCLKTPQQKKNPWEDIIKHCASKSCLEAEKWLFLNGQYVTEIHNFIIIEWKGLFESFISTILAKATHCKVLSETC